MQTGVASLARHLLTSRSLEVVKSLIASELRLYNRFLAGGMYEHGKKPLPYGQQFMRVCDIIDRLNQALIVFHGLHGHHDKILRFKNHSKRTLTNRIQFHISLMNYLERKGYVAYGHFARFVNHYIIEGSQKRCSEEMFNGTMPCDDQLVCELIAVALMKAPVSMNRLCVRLH